MERRIKEAVRYLGYGRNAADERTLALIEDAFAELGRTAAPKSVCRIFDAAQTEDGRIMPSFNSIPGLGDIAAQSIEDEAKKGEFLSMEEFIGRTKIGRTNAELIKGLGLLRNIPETNQLSIFDLVG